jgi:phospholipid/cholesterol/gamma-HCH transport system substrate-binding protein
VSGTGRKPRISPVLAGIIAGTVMVVIVAIMAKINLDFAAPWASTHTLTAQVVDADGIGVSSDVRIAGRLVGQVTDVQSRGAHTDVTFHVDDSEWPLAGDTTASIRLATLLGQKYVELQPGPDKSKKLADNGVIPEPRTRPVVDFDQILNTFDTPTRTALTGIIKTVGGAVQGQEGTLQQLLPSLNDLSQHSVTPTGELVKRDSELNNILINLGTTADQLSRSRNDLAGVIDNLNSVTGALASHPDALRGFIRNVDTLNQTTDAVLGNGGAQKFNAGLAQVDPLVQLVKNTFDTILPESHAFQDTGAYNAGIRLVYGIGDAAGQSDHYGYFLRQKVNGADLLGILGPSAGGHVSGSGSQSQGGLPPVTPPPLPVPVPTPPPLPLPTLPSIPGLPPNPLAPGGSGGSGATPPPAPIPGLPPILPTSFNGYWAFNDYAWWGSV